PRRRQPAQAPVHHLRADRRVLPHPAHQPGLARPAGKVRCRRRRQRPRALPHRHEAAELPHPPAPPPRLPADRTSLTRTHQGPVVAWLLPVAPSPPSVSSASSASDAETRPRLKYAKLCYAGAAPVAPSQITEDPPR